MTTALETARRMRQDARDDHRLSGVLKRRARSRMAELEAFCRMNGIPMELVEAEEARTDDHRGT